MPTKRIEIEQLCANFWHVTVRYGFVEIPDVPATFSKAQEAGCDMVMARSALSQNLPQIFKRHSGIG